MNKKALFGLSVEQLVKLVIVIAIVIAFFYFGAKLYAAIFGEKQPEAVNSMNALADQVSLMLQRDTTFEYSQILLVIPEKEINYAIEGFSSGDPSRPSLCKESYEACICLGPLETSGEFKAVACKTMPPSSGQVVFLSTIPQEQPSVNPYPLAAGELFYGKLEIKNNPISRFYKEAEAFTMVKGAMFYVEKYAADGKIFILVAPVSSGIGVSQDIIKKRVSALSPCPSESDSQCAGKRINEVVGNGACTYSGDRCYYEELTQCTVDVVAADKCICGDAPIIKGFSCVSSGTGELVGTYLDCTKIKSCYQYCQTKDTNTECNLVDERQLCAKNPCEKQIGGSCKVKQDSYSSGGYAGSPGSYYTCASG